MNEIPFNLYIGAEIDTGQWMATTPGIRILEGIEDEFTLKYTIYYPDVENFTHKETHFGPKKDCKLILRSLDDDMTQEEEKTIKQMGFSISKPRNYLLDENQSDKRFRIHAAAELVTYLIQQKFSLGLFSKKDYIVKTSKIK